MALDEPSENDEIYEGETFQIIIDKNLLGELGGVNVDFRSSKLMGSGFVINPTGNTGGSCSC